MPLFSLDDVDPTDPALDVLTVRQRTILLRRRTETLQAIADTEGVSRARIFQIQRTALWKLGGPKANKLRKGRLHEEDNT